jgi:hypothetical protein
MDRAFGVKIIPLPASGSSPGDTYRRFDFTTTFPDGGPQETEIFKRALEAERRVLGRVLVNEQPDPLKDSSTT